MLNKLSFVFLTTATLFGCGSDSSPPETVAPVINTAPVATSDVSLVQNNAVATINVLANDTDQQNDALTITSIITQPTSGSVEIVNNELVYTPENNVATVQTITYEISDGKLTAQANVEVTVNHTITISGLVTDSPIGNAIVTITIGNEVFEVEADGEGNYSLPITINDMSALILIKARGNASNNQQQVELITLAGDALSLIEMSGDNREITNEESNITNVTHVSTATYLLVKDRSPTGEIVSVQEYEELLSELPTEALLNTAGFIKLLVDNPDFDIPEGETVLSLLDPESSDNADENGDTATSKAIRDYLEGTGIIDSDGNTTEAYNEALAAAKAQTVSDPNVVEQFTTEDLANKLIIKLSGARAGWNEYSASGLKFNSDGTGKNYINYNKGVAVDINFTWSVEDGKVEVVYLDTGFTSFPLAAYPFDELGTNYGISEAVLDEMRAAVDSNQIESLFQLRLDQGLLRETYSLLAITTTSFQVNISGQNYVQITLPDGGTWTDSTPRFETGFEVNNVLEHTMQSEFADKTLEALQGDWLLNFDRKTVDNGIELVNVISNVVVIYGSSATIADYEETYQVALTDGVLVLTGETATYKYTPFTLNGKGYLAKVEKIVNGELEFAIARQIAKFDDTFTSMTNNLVTELPLIQSAYIKGSVEEKWENDLIKVSNLFGYQFLADGTLNRGISFSEASFNDFGLDYFRLGQPWTWESQGREITMGFVSAFLFRERKWSVISVDDEGRALVFERSVRGTDSNGDGAISDDEISPAIRPRINIIKVDDLSDYGDIWENTITVNGITAP